jgi:NTE family protein
MTRALVLAGGGVTGIAWELGVVASLHSAGIDVADADLVVGTSAGSAVAAQITSGASMDDLTAAQRTAPEESKELAVELDGSRLEQAFAVLADTSLPPVERRAKIGAMALATETIPEAQRRGIVASRLPHADWPAQALVITAVDAFTGELATFDRSSGVELVDAVAASCAVPCIWPPVTIGATRYIDGGVRSGTNADLAVGHDAVLIITPAAAELSLGLDREVTRLERENSRVEVLRADDEARRQMGPNALDPSKRGDALAAGLRQGSEVADRLRDFW